MAYRFSAWFRKEDGWSIARCPERNVTSQGKDVESARSGRSEAIELYLETWGVNRGEARRRRILLDGSRNHVALERRVGDQVFKTVVPLQQELAKGTLSDMPSRAESSKSCSNNSIRAMRTPLQDLRRMGSPAIRCSNRLKTMGPF